MEDGFPWNITLKKKITFDGRWPFMEENVLWKTPFDGRCSLKKVTFEEIQTLMEDDL